MAAMVWPTDTSAKVLNNTRSATRMRSKAAVPRERERPRDREATARAKEHYQAGDVEAFYETLTELAFRNAPVSVTLANPLLPDCPLVGVSRGFESMTGYSKAEIIGRNCRFLNRGCPMTAEVRHELRTASQTPRRFAHVLVNRRSNGEVFQNLLHMSHLRVGTCVYILGIQADVTNADVDCQSVQHLEELDRIVDTIFSASVDAWASFQASSYGVANPGRTPWLRYTQLQLHPRYDEDAYAQARDNFVSLVPSRTSQIAEINYVNTFIEISSEERSGQQAALRRCQSDPSFSKIAAADFKARPSQEMLRDSLNLLHLGSAPVHRTVETSSAGSSGHPDGCTPCSFFHYSLAGCNKGQQCEYCHLEHLPRRKRRGKKKFKESTTASHDEMDDQDGDDKILKSSEKEVEDKKKEKKKKKEGKDKDKDKEHKEGHKEKEKKKEKHKEKDRDKEDLATLEPIEDQPAGAPRLANLHSLVAAGAPLFTSFDPSPSSLMPLLAALEMLAPLPCIRCSGVNASQAVEAVPPRPQRARWVDLQEDNDGSDNSDLDTEAEVRAIFQPESKLDDESFQLQYSQSAISLGRMEYTKVLPFVWGSASAGSLSFNVDPPLPQRLLLDRRTGVISGLATELTHAEGGIHLVTVEDSSGRQATQTLTLCITPEPVGHQPIREAVATPQAGIKTPGLFQLHLDAEVEPKEE